ncbi:unnamed protein product [Prunus armeniaca]|uniref:Uncharacterized protein n=1 Tax=Prunus armeniaca TaxID=36596 RepID=A0A6J5VYH2_PRUAR|nr:unnamed protein product [Prunus armeniaca]
MPRKRSRSIQKNQHQMGRLPIADAGSNVLGHNPKSNYFFSVPGLFVGLSSKGLTDFDSVMSPTSPLDFRVFSNLGNPFRSPRSNNDGSQRSWGSSLWEVSRSSESKSILFGPDMRIKTPDS